MEKEDPKGKIQERKACNGRKECKVGVYHGVEADSEKQPELE